MPNTSVKVSIGQSTIATSEFVQRCSDMVNRSYGYNRITPNEIRQRLAMGDDEESANRVLHVAFDETGKLGVACSPSTTPAPGMLTCLTLRTLAPNTLTCLPLRMPFP